MKTKSVWKKLGRFKENGKDKKGATYFYSRTGTDKSGRYVKVIEQGENCICLPIISHKFGDEQVVFHAKTIKSLVEFLENKEGK